MSASSGTVDVSYFPDRPSTIPYIVCAGTPSEIGRTHGTQAATQIKGSIAFYQAFFETSSSLSWAEATAMAMRFDAFLSASYPRLVEEMHAVAEGAGVMYADILALNVRTEIAYGAFKDDATGDGCTALAWLGTAPSTDSTADKSNKRFTTASWLAQNWDWRDAQAENLVVLEIRQDSSPTIKMVTEGGIIGKIGLNSNGVGACLNAIRARGVDYNKIPVHLGLRLVLDSTTLAAAEELLLTAGVASACTMVLADKTGGCALEWSHIKAQRISPDDKGRVFHTNHWLLQQDGVTDTQSPPDTLDRIKRIEVLADQVDGEVSVQKIWSMLADEDGFPTSICRHHDDGKGNIGTTIFNIVMDCSNSRATVTMGRLVKPKEQFVLSF